MKELKLWFDHGLGDCVDWAQALVLWRWRGFDVRVHTEENKAWLWNACGYDRIEIDGAAYVSYDYPPEFNWPQHGELPKNKTAWNMARTPMPPIGDLSDLWLELSKIQIDVRPQIGRVARETASQWLRNLPEPVVLLHTHGTNYSAYKSIPDHLCLPLYEMLLDELNGSLILLDWDSRVPRLPHGRVRHLKDDWGHIELEQLAAVMERADLLVGVDSGPLHFAALFPELPTLGLWTHHLPWHCILRPKSNTTHLMPYRLEAREARWDWHLIEWTDRARAPKAGPEPSDIARMSKHILSSPRFFNRGNRAHDLVLQHMVDRMRSSTSSSPIADRDISVSYAFDCIASREAPLIVETGCIRGADDWGAGCFGYVAAVWLSLHGSGRLISVDNDASRLATANRLLKGFTAHVELIRDDSVRWLATNSQKIDLLYLDSLDVENPMHAEHCLAEVQAAVQSLADESLILIDDTPWSRGGWVGKGRLAVPWLTDHGWTIGAAGYQVLLERDTSHSDGRHTGRVGSNSNIAVSNFPQRFSRSIERTES